MAEMTNKERFLQDWSVVAEIEAQGEKYWAISRDKADSVTEAWALFLAHEPIALAIENNDWAEGEEPEEDYNCWVVWMSYVTETTYIKSLDDNSPITQEGEPVDRWDLTRKKYEGSFPVWVCDLWGTF